MDTATLMPNGRVFFGSFYDKTYEIMPDLRIVESTCDRAYYMTLIDLPMEIQLKVEAAREVMKAHQRGEPVRTYRRGGWWEPVEK